MPEFSLENIPLFKMLKPPFYHHQVRGTHPAPRARGHRAPGTVLPDLGDRGIRSACCRGLASEAGGQRGWGEGVAGAQSPAEGRRGAAGALSTALSPVRPGNRAGPASRPSYSRTCAPKPSTPGAPGRSGVCSSPPWGSHSPAVG